MSIAKTREGPREFHPDFKRTGAADEVVLVSKDNTLFAVPMSALARFSPCFGTMVSLPQEDLGFDIAGDTQIIALPHGTKTVHYIAAYACGTRHPALSSMAQIEGILRAAEMYDMPGLLSIMHIALRNVPSAVKMSPARRYVLARRYGLEDVRIEAEAACLANETIDMDVADEDFVLLKPVLQVQIQRMQTELNRFRHAGQSPGRKRL